MVTKARSAKTSKGARAPARSPRIWVVTADAGRARIFRADEGNTHMAEIADLVNPAARDASGKVGADRAGHVAKNPGDKGHTLAPHKDPRQQEALVFARTVGRALSRGRTRGEVERIYLVADPRFLGTLRTCLDEPTLRLVAGDVGKDMTRHLPTSIRRRLPAQL